MKLAMVKARAKARSKYASRTGGRGWWVLALVLAGTAGLAWHYRTPAQGYANVSAAYAARVACSCRFVAGRRLDDCDKDKLEGMELVTQIGRPSSRERVRQEVTIVAGGVL